MPGRVSQAHVREGLDDLLPAGGRLVQRALAARPGRDAQEVRLVGPVAADPGVLAGAAVNLHDAVAVEGEQAGLRVERLRAAAPGVRDLEGAVREYECVDFAVRVADPACGEHAGCDDPCGVRGEGCGDGLEVLRAGDGRAGW